MELTIAILAWIGLGTVSVLTAATLFVWAIWAWGHCLEYGCRMLGFFHATNYYCALVLRKDKAGTREAAGKVLFARFCHMQKAEPEIAAAFEKEMAKRKTYQENDDDDGSKG